MASKIIEFQSHRTPLGYSRKGGSNPTYATKLEELWNAILTAGIQILKESSKTFKSMPKRIVVILKTKVVQPNTRRVYQCI